MGAAVLLGAGVGLGLWLLVVWLAPVPEPLALTLRRLAAPAAPTDPQLSNPDQPWSTTARLGRRLAPLLTTWGLPRPALRRDLAVLDRSVDAHLSEQATLALLGFLTPPVAALALTGLGVPLGLGLPAFASIAMGAVGFLLPDLQVRAQAAKRRSDFRHALSAYLDLVVVSLAGGAGVDSALTDSAAIGHGWAFARLRRALDAARLTRTTAWTALNELGIDLDVADLSELAASVSLAGTEGARVRTSLAAKAQALRIHLLTDTEAQAHTATERMSLPWVLLFLGFLIFIGYPAVHQIMSGL
jgi:Flp pilus assembly protein TadB